MTDVRLFASAERRGEYVLHCVDCNATLSGWAGALSAAQIAQAAADAEAHQCERTDD